MMLAIATASLIETPSSPRGGPGRRTWARDADLPHEFPDHRTLTVRSGRRPVRRRRHHRQRHGEARAPAECAGDADLASHGVDQRPHDVEPNAGAAEPPDVGRLRLPELVEAVPDLLVVHAD